MPTVYGVHASPFVRKVRIFLAEKGVPYDLEPVMPINVSPEFKKISPLGKVPAFRDGNVTLSDSSVICAYLERVHPNPALYPSDAYDFARALWFEEYADTALSSILGAKIFFQRIVGPMFLGRPTDESVVKTAIETDVPPMFDYLESQLDSRDGIAGPRFSIGDIGLGTQFVNARHAGFTVDAGRWPKLARYIARVHERPSFKAAIDEETAAFTAR